MNKKQMNERVEKILQGLEIGTEREIVQNRFGGDSVDLGPVEVALYDFFMGTVMAFENPDLMEQLRREAVKRGETFTEEEARKNYNCVKQWFLMNNPEAYMALID